MAKPKGRGRQRAKGGIDGEVAAAEAAAEEEEAAAEAAAAATLREEVANLYSSRMYKEYLHEQRVPRMPHYMERVDLPEPPSPARSQSHCSPDRSPPVSDSVTGRAAAESVPPPGW